MFHGLYAAYAATSLSEAVRVSRWIFAVFEMVHLAGLAVLGGAVLIASVRLAGWPIGGLGRAQVWRGLRWAGLSPPWWWTDWCGAKICRVHGCLCWAGCFPVCCWPWGLPDGRLVCCDLFPGRDLCLMMGNRAGSTGAIC